MASGKMRSAKKRRFINNTIVHVVLAVLAFIWVFPILWVILTSFRAEKGSYVSTFLPREFTAFYGYIYSELSANVCKYIIYRSLFLHIGNLLCIGGFLLLVQIKVQTAETIYEYGNDSWSVSEFHVHDCSVFYFKSNRTYRGKSDQTGTDLMLLRRSRTFFPDCQRILIPFRLR